MLFRKPLFALLLLFACVLGIPQNAFQQEKPPTNELADLLKQAPGSVEMPNLTVEKVEKYRARSIENFPLNVRIFRAINDNHHPLADRFFLLFRYLGTGWVLIPVVILLMRFRPQLTIPLLIAITIETLLVNILKSTFSQGRPGVILENVHLLYPLKASSFPSGDTAMAFAIAGILCINTKWTWRVLWLLLAAMIGYERIYLGVHFPLDVTVGLIIGLLSSLAGYWFFKRKGLRQKS